MNDGAAIQIFRASRAKLGAITVVLAIVTAIGLSKAIDGNRFWALGSVIFGALTLTYLVFTVRRAMTLTLNSRGLELKSPMGNADYSWTEIYDFHITDAMGVRFLRRGFGSDHMILNVFESKTSELCDVLTKWQVQYGGPQPNASLERTRDR